MQEGKYINRYEVLFTLAREYTGCDTKGILLSIKKRMHQITDFFRIVEMKKDDLFGYKHLQPDTYWNARQIYEYTQDADVACAISGAINEIYISIKDIVE